MRYMLDTHAVSHLIKKHSAMLARVTAVPMASLCISSITEGELLFGLVAWRSGLPPDNFKSSSRNF